MKTSEIITALRCIAGPTPEDDCNKCPYKLIGIYKPEIAEKIGVEEETICDVDRICREAADQLEKFTEELDKLIEEAEA